MSRRARPQTLGRSCRNFGVFIKKILISILTHISYLTIFSSSSRTVKVVDASEKVSAQMNEFSALFFRIHLVKNICFQDNEKIRRIAEGETKTVTQLGKSKCVKPTHVADDVSLLFCCFVVSDRVAICHSCGLHVGERQAGEGKRKTEAEARGIAQTDDVGR